MTGILREKLPKYLHQRSAHGPVMVIPETRETKAIFIIVRNDGIKWGECDIKEKALFDKVLVPCHIRIQVNCGQICPFVKLEGTHGVGPFAAVAA